MLSENELRNGVIRRVCNMWFTPLNHKDTKAWMDRKLSERTPTSPAHEPISLPVTSVGVALQRKNPGYGWEDRTILLVLPDDRALV